jgi:hypothetical protein
MQPVSAKHVFPQAKNKGFRSPFLTPEEKFLRGENQRAAERGEAVFARRVEKT